MERSKWIHLKMDIIHERLWGGKCHYKTRLYSTVPKKEMWKQTFLGEVENNSFISWPSRRASGLVTKAMPNPWRGWWEVLQFSGQQRCVELMGILNWLASRELSSIINFLVSNSLRTCIKQFSSERGQLPVKTVQEYVSGLFMFQGAASLKFCCVARMMALLLLVSQPNSYSVSTSSHFQPLTTESGFFTAKNEIQTSHVASF